MKQLNHIIQLCKQGKFEYARKALLELEQTQGLYDDAFFLMGSILGQLGKFEEALAYYQKAIDLAPGKSQAYIGKTKALLILGRTGEAETCYEQLLQHQCGSAEVVLQLATLLMNHNQYEAAERRFLQALELEDKSVTALSGLGKVYRALHKPMLAKNYLEKAIQVDPENSQNYYMLGTLEFSQGQVEEAEKCFKKALELDDKNSAAYRDLGHLQLSMNRPTEARKQFQHAMALQPNNLDDIAALARLEDQSGNLHVAYDLLRPFIEQNIMHADVGIVYAAICHHFDRCREAVNYMERLLDRVSDQQAGKPKLHFALGKLYDRLGEYDRAFSHFEQGNMIKPDYYNRVEDAACIDKLIKTCDWNYFISAPRSTQTTEKTVFIVGMPRSGTTLTEQILASHPDVCGLGEVSVFPSIIRDLQLYLGAGTSYPENLRHLTPSILDSMATTYLECIRALCLNNALRVTDKTLVNFLYIGLILQIFPKAKIIHCARDPRDTCLSIFFQQFDESHHYASRLENLGHYYSQYRRVMNHWKSILGDSILEIKYEDMVNNQEEKSRELVDFAGLEWDERVLKFYESRRSVATASYDQVRQKIYTGSKARWKNYEKHIEPLVKALEFPLEQDA
jgi:tetratricopeptide (TPR) repeat protein